MIGQALKPWGFSVPAPRTELFFSQVSGSTDLIAMVYEALSNMKIAFYYSYFFGDALFTEMLQEVLRVHFYIPEANIVIIVKGGYFYTKPAEIEKLALQMAMLQYTGVKTYVFLEREIFTIGAATLISAIPELKGHAIGGPMDTGYEPVRYHDFYTPWPTGFKIQKKTRFKVKRHKRHGST